MEVLILQAFVSLMLVGGALLLFTVSWRQRDHEHADRLALLPAEDDEGQRPHGSRESEPVRQTRDHEESNVDGNRNHS